MIRHAIRLIPKIIISIRSLFISTIVLTLVLSVQGLFFIGVKSTTIVWQGECSFEDWNQSGTLGMIIDCGEHGEKTLMSDSLIRSYLNNPGPLTCRLSEAGTVRCEERPTFEGGEA